MNEKLTGEDSPGLKVTAAGADSAELAERIRKRVHEKIVSGFYDEKEVERIARLAPQAKDRPGGYPFISAEERKSITAALDASWDVTRPCEARSPRGGLAGKLVTFSKKLYNALVHPAVKFSLVRQAEHNSAVNRGIMQAFNKADDIVRNLNEMSARYTGLSQRVAYLEKTLDDASSKISGVEQRGEGLSERVETLAAALRDLDKQGIFIRRRVSKLLDELSAGIEGAGAPALKREREKLEGFDYTLFENLHRGSREEIKGRMRVYADWFRGAQNVLDIGCGRGELLELFRENGISARGIDINDEMVEECARLGLDAREADAISYLESLPDNSLGGLAAIQLIEHLPVEGITEFFRLACDKLAPGATIAAETVNPQCLTTFCGAFYLDMTHMRPIHPLAVQFLLERIGFSDVRIEYLSPYPEEARLSRFPLDPSSGIDPDFVIDYNRNIDKLNGVMYSHMDYAVVARK